MVVAADGALSERAERAGDGIVWHLEAKGHEDRAGGGVQPGGRLHHRAGGRGRADASPGGPATSGKKVSFEFKDIDIHNLLRVIAEVSKKNIVVADDVSGKITIRLRNVPWDQALDIILASKGLGKEEIGDIIRVAPLKTLEEEARLREERKKALRRQEELLVKLIPVNYAAADRDGAAGEGRAQRARHRRRGPAHQHPDRPGHRQQHRQGSSPGARSSTPSTPQVLDREPHRRGEHQLLAVDRRAVGRLRPGGAGLRQYHRADLPQHRPGHRWLGRRRTPRPAASRLSRTSR